MEFGQFEWDDRKARRNLVKHGVSFDEAATIFRDLFAVELDDLEHSWGECRWILIGSSASGRVLLVVYVERDPQEGKIRVISARKATPAERSIYESQANPGPGLHRRG